MTDLLERISTEVLLADGAMGTMLHSHGVGFDKCFDELNLTNPGAVAEIHRAYIDAGAQLVDALGMMSNSLRAGPLIVGCPWPGGSRLLIAECLDRS